MLPFTEADLPDSLHYSRSTFELGSQAPIAIALAVKNHDNMGLVYRLAQILMTTHAYVVSMTPGISLACHAAVKNKEGLYAVRFLLGLVS